ncbi:MAG: hypothetical protein N2517_01455 [Ignavibacteria bacterium]|nr:hypothetical protein [Ignavibacteria bacterium]
MNTNNVELNVNIEKIIPKLSSNPPSHKPRTKEKDFEKTNEIGDKLEISEEARRLQQIKSKIESGFYNNLEIIQKTAEKIFNKI